MQKAQLLSQPIWIVTHALYDVSRTAGSADGNSAWSSMTAASKISVIAPCLDPRSSSAARWTLCVPITTSTWAARSADEATVLLGEAAGDDDLASVALRLPGLEVAEVAVQLVVGVLADAARVEHDDISVGELTGRDHAIGLEQPSDALGVVLVHLAPERAHDIAPSTHGSPGYRWYPTAFCSLGP